eukprot:7269793-Prymnesium_polylepis.1
MSGVPWRGCRTTSRVVRGIQLPRGQVSRGMAAAVIARQAAAVVHARALSLYKYAAGGLH